MIFVFYTIRGYAKWCYIKNFPKTWRWIGGGHTNPFTKDGMSQKYSYLNEEQFMGSFDNRDKMVEYLKNFFDKLKNDGKIKKYKIRYSYKP